MAGLSDPYAILRVGPQTFTSKHIDNTDCPKWEEMYEVRLGDVWTFLNVLYVIIAQVLEDSIIYHATCSVFEGLELGMFIFIHGSIGPQPASIQIPLSVLMSLYVSGTSGYSP